MTWIVLKQGLVLSLLKNLSKKGAGTKNLRVTQVKDATIYSSNMVNVKLSPEATDSSVENPAKPSPFHFDSFYNRAHLLWKDLQLTHRLHAAFSASSFPDFMGVKVPITPSMSTYS